MEQFAFEKHIWKGRLKNVVHFVQAPMLQNTLANTCRGTEVVENVKSDESYEMIVSSITRELAESWWQNVFPIKLPR